MLDDSYLAELLHSLSGLSTSVRYGAIGIGLLLAGYMFRRPLRKAVVAILEAGVMSGDRMGKWY